MTSITVPTEMGWVILLWVPAMAVTNELLGGNVMGARKKFGVKYPNLYAVPGEHDKADAFNSVQRGHGNFLERANFLAPMALIGSLYSPNFALANAFGGVCWNVGSILYMKGYATNKEDGKGRYAKGGIIKHFGTLIGLVTSIATGLKVLGYIE